VLDQCQQAVVVGAARGAHGQVQGDAREPDASVELGLDVALEQHARRPAARVALVELEDRFEQAADAALAR
jgi:hypothetical protein